VLTLIVFASAILIKLSITMASVSASFWMAGSSFMLPSALHQVGDLAKYPITVYSTAIQAGLTLVIPFAFIGFFPATAVLGHGASAWIGWLTPAVAAYSVLVAWQLFRLGLRRYESSGN
jgi:ABC-2 type transport system permease protein